MAGYQYVIVVGNLTADPELRYLASGTACTNFTVAVNRSWVDKSSGEKREEVTYFRVAAWRQLGEVCKEHLAKGRQVMVTGRVSASAFIGQDGNARASLELTAQDVQFLSRKGESQGESSGKPVESEELPF